MKNRYTLFKPGTDEISVAIVKETFRGSGEDCCTQNWYLLDANDSTKAINRGTSYLTAGELIREARKKGESITIAVADPEKFHFWLVCALLVNGELG